jgi:hypothetical protein
MKVRKQVLVSFAAIAALAAPAFAQTAQTLSQPFSAEGELKGGDRRTSEKQRYDEFLFNLRANQRVRIASRSDAFDTVLEIYRQGGDSDAVASNDDSGGELHSRITFTPRESGLYRVRVKSLGEDGKGAYTLTAEEIGPLPAPLRPVATGTSRMELTSYEGTLADGDFTTDDGAWSDDYLMRFEEGQEVLLRLDATDFDPVVRIFSADNREGDEIKSDDDSGGDTASLLLFKPETTGDYIVRVTSYQKGEGSYRLRVGR